jgi:hypothetical protein
MSDEKREEYMRVYLEVGKSGTAPPTGEIGKGDLKTPTTIGMMCLCNKNIESRWTRRNNFARMRRVLQEAKEERATFGFMIGSGDAIAVEGVDRSLVLGAEPC